MKRFCIASILFLMTVTAVFAGFDDTIDKVDKLNYKGQHQECMDLLDTALSQANNDTEKAQVYWRKARTILNITDIKKDEGAPDDTLIAEYQKGEEAADKAIELDPTLAEPYHWKSSNIGRAGQVKGVLNSLMKAKPMKKLLEKVIERDSEFADTYYVLGTMYRLLPGWPLSFGDVDKAVSLSRLAIDLMEEELQTGERIAKGYDHYLQLAENLYNRDWNKRKRNNKQKGKKRDYNRADSPLEKGFNYEGVVNIPSKTDQQEAIDIVETVIRELENKSDKTPSNEKDLKKARELLSEWQ